MATADGLCNLGLADELARVCGWSIVSITTTAATQNSAGGLLSGTGNKIVLATPASAGDAITLPAAASPGDEIQIYNLSGANNGKIFPQTGGTINQLAVNTATNVSSFPVNGAMSFIKVSATSWRARTHAAVA